MEKKGLLLIVGALLVGGCQMYDTCYPVTNLGEPFDRTLVVATYTAEHIKANGILNEKAWLHTPVYRFEICSEAYSGDSDKLKRLNNYSGTSPQEAGMIRLLWDEKNLYIGFDMKDSDIIAESDHDQEKHFAFGDVIEVFIKPCDETYYWESYAVPSGRKSMFFITGSGAIELPHCFDERNGLKISVSANIDGTLNCWRDQDRGWSAKMVIPFAELEKLGAKFYNNQWLIFFGRYNYSRFLRKNELSSFPQQQKLNFHSIEDYGVLKLERR